jgi:hypothetical protein
VLTHTYATGNYYQIWLRVTDNSGGISYAYSSVTVSNAPHVGDLDGSSTSLKSTWTPAVAITVHDANHQAMVNVTVSGIWSTNAGGSCVTNGIGQCAILLAAAEEFSRQRDLHHHGPSGPVWHVQRGGES